MKKMICQAAGRCDQQELVGGTMHCRFEALCEGNYANMSGIARRALNLGCAATCDLASLAGACDECHKNGGEIGGTSAHIG